MIIYHIHHIVPKHLGGTDDASNLVKVTIQKHAELHKQLWEDLGHWEDELAWKALSGQIGKEEIISIKIREGGLKGARKSKSEETKRKMSLYHTGKKRSELLKKSISKSHVGKKLSEETKKKISQTVKLKGIKPPTGSGKDNPFFGKKHSEETKKRISEKKKLYYIEKRKKLNSI